MSFGDGTLNAPVVFILDAPSEEDQRRRRLLTGKAGAEFDYWLERTCRLTRNDVWITSLQESWSKKDRDATPDEIERLNTEIQAVGPRVIVPFGNEITRLLLGAWADVEFCHGLLHPPLPTPPHAAVLPVTSPANQTHYDLMVQDFETLGTLMRGGMLPFHDVDTAPVHYTEFRDEIGVGKGLFLSDVIAIDTEGSTTHPWCLTFSCRDRAAGLIRHDQPAMLRMIEATIYSQEPTVVMHYAPHDLRVLDAMGVHIDTSRVRVLDTMQLAYIAGRLPQGLKALSYRLCGMRQRDYMDLVGPHNDRIARAWLAARADEWRDLHKAAPTDIKRAITGLVKFADSKAQGTLHERWGNSVIAERLGIADPMPAATLDDVPFEEVLQYACADADATRRVFFKLREYFD